MLFNALDEFLFIEFDPILSDVHSLFMANVCCSAQNNTFQVLDSNGNFNGTERTQIGNWKNDQQHLYMNKNDMQLVQDLIVKLENSE